LERRPSTQPHPHAAWFDRLNAVERGERESPLFRFARNPWKRLRGVGFNRLVYAVTRRGLTARATTFWDDAMQVTLPAGLDIYLTGAKVHPSEIRLARYFIHRITDGMTVVDAGAHFGFYSLLASKLVGPRGKVYSFEPTPNTFKVLHANQRPNQKIFQLALSSSKGEVQFENNPTAHSEANKVTDVTAKNVATITVQTDTLDNACLGNGIKPDLVKMDVEGHEAEALQGATQMLSNHKPSLVLELWHPSHPQHHLHRQAIELLANIGYALHRIDETGLPQPATLGDVFSSGLDSDNVLFLPR
jgi:FkbM family methyltransferase